MCVNYVLYSIFKNRDEMLEYVNSRNGLGWYE